MSHLRLSVHAKQDYALVPQQDLWCLVCCFNCLCYLKSSLECERLWLCQQSSLYSSVIHSTYQVIMAHVFQCCIIATKLSYLSKFCNEFGCAFYLLLVSRVEFTTLNYHQRFGTVVAAQMFKNVFVSTFFRFIWCHEVLYHLVGSLPHIEKDSPLFLGSLYVVCLKVLL